MLENHEPLLWGVLGRLTGFSVVGAAAACLGGVLPSAAAVSAYPLSLPGSGDGGGGLDIADWRRCCDGSVFRRGVGFAVLSGRALRQRASRVHFQPSGELAARTRPGRRTFGRPVGHPADVDAMYLLHSGHCFSGWGPRGTGDQGTLEGCLLRGAGCAMPRGGRRGTADGVYWWGAVIGDAIWRRRRGTWLDWSDKPKRESKAVESPRDFGST